MSLFRSSSSRRLLIVVLLAPVAWGLGTLMGSGCDRSGAEARKKSDTTPPAVPPALAEEATRQAKAARERLPAGPTRPVGSATGPTTLPSDEDQRISYLHIQYPKRLGTDGAALPPVAYKFPLSRMRLTVKGDEPITALLYTDEPNPKEAIKQAWSGDRYYFQMELRTEDLKQLESTPWRVTASASNRDESPNGIFFSGDRVHLDPVNVLVQFEGQSPNLIVHVQGEFLQYDSTSPRTAPEPVYIAGTLLPKVDVKN